MVSPRSLNLFPLSVMSFSVLSRAFDPLFPYNATGSYHTTNLFTVPDQTPQLVFGVSSHVGTGSVAYELTQQIWLDNTTDCKSMQTSICAIFFDGNDGSEEAQESYTKLQNSQGSCQAAIPSQCTDDITHSYSQYVEQNLRNSSVQDPCYGDEWTFKLPDTCKSLQGNILGGELPVTLTGNVAAVNEDCSPMTSLSTTVPELSGNATQALDTMNGLYDFFTTQVIPIALVAGNKNDGVKGGVICAETTNFTAGSRKPSGVPQKSPQSPEKGGAGRNYEVVGSILALALTAACMAML